MGPARHRSRLVQAAALSRLARSRLWRHWRGIPLLVMGLSAPAALAQALGSGGGVNAPGVNDASCRTMELPLVYTVTLAVALGAFLSLYLVKRRLTKEGWSLANALSEPVRLAIPVESRWSESGGDQLSIASKGASSRKVIGDLSGKTENVMLLEASSSRMIATLGGFGILMLYMGFGTFALYSFGLTCQLPTSMTAVTTFLLSGLSLFAPYVANKVSTAIQPRDSKASSSPPPPSPVSSDGSGTRSPEPAYGSPSSLHPGQEPHPASDPGGTTAPVAAAAVIATTTHQATATAAPTVARSSVPASTRGADSSESHAGTPSQAYEPALAMIRTFEGFASQAYPDPASGAEPWTIGYGFTTLQGQAVRPGQTITRTEADAELQRQVEVCAKHLAATIPDWGRMTGNQRCALLDFAWNLGADFYGDTANFASITRDLQTHDWQQVPQTLLLYCDPGTAVEAGLLRRRQAEAALWRSPEPAPSASATPSASAPAPSSPSPPSARRFANPLKVPYCDQLQMADGQGWRECFSASASMLAMYWGKEPNENVYDGVRARFGDSTSSEAQLDALRSLGLRADFRTDGSADMLQREIDAGRPVAVGWLCDGPVSAPSGGGHWIVIIGYDKTGFFVNDPYGNCDLLNGGYLSHHDGAGLHYSNTNWLPRWRVGGSGGWMLTCRL
ncbi:MAG: glycoside hydrolase family protein [Cyanobacteriota bacterium]